MKNAPAKIIAEGVRPEKEVLLGQNGKNNHLGDEDFQNLFKVQPASKWLDEAKKRPIPKMLFGEFWFEGEICILFADTNVGKSILAVQIADAISKGKSISGIPLETEAQKVIYFDFELSDKQFEARYSEKSAESDYFANHFQFHKNFYRAEIDPNADIEHKFGTFENYLNHSLKYTIADTGAKILIIDNLTYLKNETEKAKDALPLMKHLKELKRKFNLSILALAHTPKRNMLFPLTRNDLQGSKMLINFCDSSFAIGESTKEKGLRYLKQIKVRNGEVKYDSDNVCLCQIEKPTNFLHFEMIGFGNERAHLKELNSKDRDDLIEKANKLSDDGKSLREIASELDVTHTTVRRYLKKKEKQV